MLNILSRASIERFSAAEAAVRFNELVRLLEQNGFRLIREKVRFATIPSPVWTGSFGLTIMELKISRQELATLF
jgi:hypothetical protein